MTAIAVKCDSFRIQSACQNIWVEGRILKCNRFQNGDPDKIYSSGSVQEGFMQGALIAITYAQIGSGSSQGTPDSHCADPAESLNCTLPICLLRSSFQRGRFISGVLMVAISACMGLSAQSQSQAAAPAHLTIDPGEIVTPVSPTLDRKS